VAPSRPSSPPSNCARMPGFDAFAKGVRIWRGELVAYLDDRPRRGSDQQSRGHQTRAHGIPSFTAFRDRVLLASD
jgi:chemotaxis signal transduction protein